MRQKTCYNVIQCIFQINKTQYLEAPRLYDSDFNALIAL